MLLAILLWGIFGGGNDSCNLTLSTSIEYATCNDGGSIIMNFTGGCPPYRISIQDSLLNQVTFPRTILIQHLASGYYKLKIQDGKSCIEERIVHIKSIPKPKLLANITNPSILLSVEGESAPYRFSWLGSDNHSRERKALDAGTYVAIVRDKYGCSDSISIVIPQDSTVQYLQPKKIIAAPALPALTPKINPRTFSSKVKVDVADFCPATTPPPKPKIKAKQKRQRKQFRKPRKPEIKLKPLKQLKSFFLRRKIKCPNL